MKVIKNGKVVCPEGRCETDIVFNDEQIVEIGNDLAADEIIDAHGLTVIPGLVDGHVHLREPGFTRKETILTGSKAAACGGFTSIFAMPNVLPYPSDETTMRDYKAYMDQQSIVRAYPYATITVDEAGKQVVDMAALKKYTKWFSDDGVGIADDAVMRSAMEQAKKEGVLIAMHTEDMKYRKPGASVHDSPVNRERGYIGIPSICEAEPLKRDLDLAVEIGNAYHGCHISARESVAYLRQAKQAGGNISAEVTAHHLLLEDTDVQGPMWKMNPPLRTHRDRMALIEALEDGTIDVIANDHAPHTLEEKKQPMDKAPFGIVSLETSFPLLYTEFVDKQKRWTLEQLVQWMAAKPAARFGIRAGQIKAGYQPDFAFIDLEKEYIIKTDNFKSMGKNTPFAGRKVKGRVCQTIVAGQIVWEG